MELSPKLNLQNGIECQLAIIRKPIGNYKVFFIFFGWKLFVDLKILHLGLFLYVKGWPFLPLLVSISLLFKPIYCSPRCAWTLIAKCYRQSFRATQHRSASWILKAWPVSWILRAWPVSWILRTSPVSWILIGHDL